MKKKGKFAGKGQAILGKEKPTGLGDFLDEQSSSGAAQGPKTPANRKSGKTVKRIYVKPVKRKSGNPTIVKPDIKTKETVRFELRLGADLAEALRTYAFDKRKTKKAVIVDVLAKHLKKSGYLPYQKNIQL